MEAPTAELAEILACPRCKGAVELQPEADRIVCAPCRLAYPIRDGIPVMLPEEAQRLSEVREG